MTLQTLGSKSSVSRISSEEALELFTKVSLPDLGLMAAQANQAKNHGQVYFNEHRYLRLGSQSDPSLLVKEIHNQANHLISPSTTELRLGSVNPKRLPLRHLITIIQSLRNNYPLVQIRALSAFHVLQYTQLENTSLETVLKNLVDAGSHYLDGRGAGLFGFKLGSQAGHLVIAPELWLKVHRVAHLTGMRSDATMAYGHGEDPRFIVEHLTKIRHLQDETAGFCSFIPLANQFPPERLGLTPTSIAFNDLKIIATSRLFLDNIANLRVPWGRHGRTTAQIALCFGANELEGSVSNANNSLVAGARPFRSMNRNEIESLVNKAYCIPIERDSSYKALNRRDHPCQATDGDLTNRLLYKCERGAGLSVNELENLANHAGLLQLAHCASLHGPAPRNVSFRQAMVLPEKKLEPSQKGTNYIWDLGLLSDAEFQTLNLATMLASISAASATAPQASLTVKGLKHLWQLAKRESMTLPQLLAALKATQVSTIESSLWETEDDLTNTEVCGTHRAIHQCDMASVAKIELAAPYNGTARPFWSNFFSRLAELKNLQAETGGLVALSLEKAKGSVISPCEYLRALALTKIFANEIPNIIAPAAKLPSFSQNSEKDLLNLAPLTILFGANDLGDFSEENSYLKLCDELKRLAFKPWRRDSRFHQAT